MVGHLEERAGIKSKLKSMIYIHYVALFLFVAADRKKYQTFIQFFSNH